MKIFLSFALCLLFSVSFGQGRGFRTEGREFYLGYLHPSINKVVPPITANLYKVYALIGSTESNIINISYFDKATQKETHPTIYKAQRGGTVIELDRQRMIANDSGDRAEYLACHITAKRPITLQYFSTGANSGGSYLALPVSSWGKKYTVASYNDNGTGAGAWLSSKGAQELDLAAGVFTIVAAYDNTQVTITPTARTLGGHVGVNQGLGATGKPVPYTVTLDRGQCYMVKSASAYLEGRDDISGSTVKANKPIAVIAGHENADVGDGGTGGRSTEARDFMIEQMIPFEFWDSTGHITIPMNDSPSNNGDGVGEDMRIYAYEEKSPDAVMAERPGQVLIQTGAYQMPGTTTNVNSPAHFYSDSGTKFMVVQYDLRNHGSGAPFPAPSMMSVIPRSNWANAYKWYVPTNIVEKLQAYYITIIALKDGVERYHEPSEALLKKNWFSDSIKVSLNGSNNWQTISHLGSQKKVWTTIPGHPDLRAVTFQVSPGTAYHIRAPFPFMVYHFGNRALDPYGDLGDYDGSDYFFSYTMPAGASLADRPVASNLSVTIDTLCNGWRICATDGNIDGGIRFVSLISDPLGDLFSPQSRQLSNISILSPNDPLRIGEFHLTGDQKSYCFEINVDDPGSNAFAPVAIYDKAGNYRILELSRGSQQVSITPNIIDSVYRFTPPKIGDESCVRFVFRNFSSNLNTYTINTLSTSSANFTISSIEPPLPAVIGPGDTLGFTVCFATQDTMVHRDTVVFGASCLGFRIPMEAVGANPVLVASDVEFGDVSTNDKVCQTLQLRNAGTVSFAVSAANFVPNNGKFFLDSASAAMLPRILPPGTILNLSVCYLTGTEGPDTARIDWVTDIQPPFVSEHKPYSLLTSRGIKSGIEWDRILERMYVEAGKEVFSRIYLKNIGVNTATINKITLSGTDVAEFKLTGIENSTANPPYAGYSIPPGDSAWIQVSFKPDSKPASYIRHAEIQAISQSNLSEIKFVSLEGIVIASDVKDGSHSGSIRMRPNPARDRVTFDIALEHASDVSVMLYDVLGREVVNRSFTDTFVGMNSLTLDLPKLAAGTYVVMVKAGGITEIEQLIVK